MSKRDEERMALSIHEDGLLFTFIPQMSIPGHIPHTILIPRSLAADQGLLPDLEPGEVEATISLKYGIHFDLDGLHRALTWLQEAIWNGAQDDQGETFGAEVAHDILWDILVRYLEATGNPNAREQVPFLSYERPEKGGEGGDAS